MFDNYTIKQLVEFRSLCANMIEKTKEVPQRADALLVLELIDKELAIRSSTYAAA